MKSQKIGAIMGYIQVNSVGHHFGQSGHEDEDGETTSYKPIRTSP